MSLIFLCGLHETFIICSCYETAPFALLYQLLFSAVFAGGHAVFLSKGAIEAGDLLKSRVQGDLKDGGLAVSQSVRRGGKAGAKNEGAGQFTNMGIGLGMMAGVGGGIANMVGGAVNTAFNGTSEQSQAHPSVPVDAFCENCGAKLTPGAAFCDECGTKVAVPDNICRNCGYQFERPGKFCPKCGTKREG